MESVPMRICRNEEFKRFTILLVIILTPCVAFADAAGTAWSAKSLRPMSWTYIRSDEQAAHYVRLPVERRKGGLPRIWGRTEMSPAAAGALRSEADYMEIDCSQNSLRALKMMQYGGNNLSGSVHTVTLPTAWAHVPRGSLGETILKIGCMHH